MSQERLETLISSITELFEYWRERAEKAETRAAQLENTLTLYTTCCDSGEHAREALDKAILSRTPWCVRVERGSRTHSGEVVYCTYFCVGVQRFQIAESTTHDDYCQHMKTLFERAMVSIAAPPPSNE